jgi:nicotinamidase-related amidase
MSSFPIRDQKKDHLLTPENSVLIIIDYQPPQLFDIVSMDRYIMVQNVVATIKLAKLFKIPIVVSTVGVSSGRNETTVSPIGHVTKDLPSYDRTTINAWEDKEFLAAVKATGRNKLIVCALWTEACLLFPALDALKEGYEVYPVVDAVGGTSTAAHETALRRMEKAGAQLTTVMSLVCELQRDWARTETLAAMFEVMSGIAGISALSVQLRSSP